MARKVTLTLFMFVPDGDDEDCVQDALDHLEGFNDNTTFDRDGKRFFGTSTCLGGADWEATVEGTP